MPTLQPICARDNNPRALETWHLAFLLVMLTSGYLSIAVSQIALGLGLILMLARWAICRSTTTLV